MYRKALQKEKMSCVPYNSTKDKLTRFLEHEWEFARGEIFFEPDKNSELIEDIILFPNSEYKDVVDSFVFGIQWWKGSEIHRISSK